MKILHNINTSKKNNNYIKYKNILKIYAKMQFTKKVNLGKTPIADIRLM